MAETLQKRIQNNLDRIKNIQKNTKMEEVTKANKIKIFNKRVLDLKQELAATQTKPVAKKEKKIKKLNKPRASRVSSPKEIDFETYFSIARRGNKKLKAHHMKPMKNFFAQALGKNLATKEEFDKVLMKY